MHADADADRRHTDPQPAPASAEVDRHAGAWYRQPIVWLGIVLLAASLAGCVWMIVLGSRFADEPMPVGADKAFKVPLSRPAAPAPTPAQP